MSAEPPTETLIPPLIESYPALVSLYRAVVKNPTQDEPRLQFADACLEAADEGAPDAVRKWAEFIQLQFARHKMGTPRHTFVDAEITPAGGPDYYQMPAFDHQAVPVVGERVDVKPHKSQVVLRKVSSTKTLHGLKVVRVEPSGWDGQWTVTLKRDALIVPFPQKAYAAALKAEDAALKVWLWKWSFNPLPEGFSGCLTHDLTHDVHLSQRPDAPAGAWQRVRWEKGFVSRLEVNELRPDALAWLVRMFPIHTVKAANEPRMSWDRDYTQGTLADADSGRWVIRPTEQQRTMMDLYGGLWTPDPWECEPPVVELLRKHFPRVVTWEIVGHRYGQNRPS